ncbi:elongator complex protein 1-like [Antedon mediterranea]|uniref:elongator complex protein 1-like n=1 Tax=Antedon mediterranea TaxID=105859 RepID=UPI003AF8A1E1
MRNLQLQTCRRTSQVAELIGVVCSTVDCDTGRLYTSNSRSVVGLDPVTNQVSLNVSLTTEGYIQPNSTDHVIGLQHIPDQQSVCAATNRGDVLLINTITNEIECIGSVDQGLKAVSWSPDQELVVLATGQDTLILMTKDFDPITETSLHPEEFGEGKPVTVGWGKKETQFHGSMGKQAATLKPEAVTQSTEWDDAKIRICWRGDGQFFVVSCISPVTGARKLRVWNRECILQYTSEDVNGLEHSLYWKPSGSLIASSQRLPHRHDIVFFEKNGLRHGEFTLPFGKQEVKVIEVQWNLDSHVLAVWLEDIPTTDNVIPKSYVQLWTVNNYHWYLKQSLNFKGTSTDRIVTMEWDPEQAYCMHIITNGGDYYQYTWYWATNHSRGMTQQNQANVAVIDGNQVLMTPFKTMVVPPPMSAYTLKLQSSVNQIVFAPPPICNQVAVVLSDGRLAFYGIDVDALEDEKVDASGGTGFKGIARPHVLKNILSIEDENGEPVLSKHPISFSHFHWLNQDTILAITKSDETNDTTCVVHLGISRIGTEQSSLKIKSRSTIFGDVYHMTSNSCTGTIAVQLSDGQVTNLENDFTTKLPQTCTQMELCKINEEEVVLGLTERYRFYINEQDVANNCTSFTVHDEFLLLTTHSHTCRCISLQNSIKDLALSANSSQLDENIRRVERGSRIVVAVPGETKLVLQMPRGNLETIHPRALILSTIKKYLDTLDYKKAFDVARKHRINLNILFDDNAKVFYENTDVFVKKIENVTHLNLFLTELKDEDVTETMYSWAYRSKVKDTNKPGSKIDAVCDVIRESCIRINPEKYLLSILTTHIKKTTPELETALRCVLDLRSNQSSNHEQPTPDQALKYIMYLVDVNKLFDLALGTYDFDLVLMVAAKSQKDPKEYLPFLNNLKNLEANYRMYSIDKHLGRFSKALDHISKCPEHFDECLALIKEHKLHSLALSLFTYNTDKYKAVATSYAEYLTEKNRHEEAGTLYTLSGEWSDALEAYVKCGNWQQVFCLTARLGYGQDKVSMLARKLAGYLTQHRRHAEAAVVLEEYADDHEDAIATLICGAVWEEALRLMYKHKRTDIIETNLKPALKERCQEHVESIVSVREEFENHKARLAVVRENKERVQNDLLDDVAGNNPDTDLYSETSSITGSTFAGSTGTRSTFTAYSEANSRISGRSAKNKRKAASKRRSLRQGSEEEDLALLEELQQIYKNIDGLKGEIGSLLKMLVLFHFEKDAQILQSSLYDMLKLLEKSTCEIWPKTDENQSTQSFGPQATSNTIAAALMQGTSQISIKQSDLALFVPSKLSKDDKWRVHQLETKIDK